MHDKPFACAAAVPQPFADLFPDEVFRTYVLNTFDTDQDGYLSDDELAAVEVIECSNGNVASLEGIELFPNLEELYCDPFTFGLDGALTEVDLSNNTALRIVDLGCNPLTSIDVSMLHNLEELNVGFTYLRALDVSQNGNLQRLWVDDANLHALDLSHNENLVLLDACGNPNLSQIYLNSYSDLLTDYLAGERHIDLPYLNNTICVYGGEEFSYNLAINTWMQIVTPTVCTLNAVTGDSEGNEIGSIDVTPTGTLYMGNKVVVTAPSVVGYSFKGWYNGDTKLTGAQTYSFEIREDTALVAKYDEIVTVKVGLNSLLLNRSNTAGYSVHYWIGAEEKSIGLTATGKTETKTIDGADVTFVMYTVEIPAAAVRYQINDGSQNIGAAAELQSSDAVYVSREGTEKTALYERWSTEFCGHRLLLSEEIGIQFKIKLDKDIRTEDCYMEFSYSDRQATITQPITDATVENGYYWFTANTNALELADTVTARFHYGSETVEEEYSVMQYFTAARAALGNNEKLMALINALQDYGHYVQASGWKDENAVHTPITAVTENLEMCSGEDLETLAGFAIEKPKSDDTRVTFSLALNSKTRICVSSVVGGVKKTYETESIGPKNLDKIYKVEIETDSGVKFVNVCALSYVHAVMHSSLTEAEKLAMTAFYKYYLAAEAY